MLKLIVVCATLALAFASPATAEDATQSQQAAAATPASEVPQAVKDACKDDYEKHCNRHAPESAAAHDCMAHAFEKLSDPCVTAILDSPLAEQEQQRLANAQASERNGAEAPKTTAPKRVHEAQAAKSATRTAKARHAAASKNSASNTARHVAHRQVGPRRSVASHIRRGTGIANHYVAKYTRFAFAKAFR